MIISASRRTDIPAFYSEWFMNSVIAGYCRVPNPFNRNQVSKISLKPEDVDVIVFWTRNPRPLFPYLSMLDKRGFKYYFLYTIMGNPRELDPHCPQVAQAIKTFKELSNRVGSDRVVWRYDPIVFSPITTPSNHLSKFTRIASELDGYTKRTIISIVDIYKKAQYRLNAMTKRGIPLGDQNSIPPEKFDGLMFGISDAAAAHSMELSYCADKLNLTRYGGKPGKCIDGQMIMDVFGVDVLRKKDPGQREACGCVVSRDIGVYDTCQFGCQYCYATTSFEYAKTQYKGHENWKSSIIG